MSINNEARGDARQRSLVGLEHYNLKLGRTTLAFSGSFGISYVDNARILAQSTGGDLYLQPGFGLELRSPITEHNQINISMQGGYVAYVRNSQLDRFFISPSSELSFDVKVGGVRINLHERPYISQFAYQDPTATSAQYMLFQNTLGANAVWDMNRALLSAGFDHINFMYLQTANRNISDAQAEVIYLQGGAKLKPGRVVGLELGLSLIAYQHPTVDNPITGGKQYSLGLFYAEQLSQHLQFKLHGGYTIFAMDLPPQLQALGSRDQSGFYVTASLTHHIHERMSYTLSGGQQVQVALQGGNYSVSSIRWDADLRFFRKFGLNTYLRYERWSQVTPMAGQADSFNRLMAGVTLSRKITEKLTGQISYDHILKDDPSPASSYNANIFSLSFTYRF
jgi:hypothetical protein